MTFEPGDHICAVYDTEADLASIAAAFLAEGLRRGERCWYVVSRDEEPAVRAALRAAGIDTAAETARGALRLIPARQAYLIHGQFDPEVTVGVFNDAIEDALAAGFRGLRAAAEMSWALEPGGGVDRLITYEALLRTLFANCRATGLCLYDRRLMPIAVIDGALATHAIAGVHGHFKTNPFYDPSVRTLGNEDARATEGKLRSLVARR